MPYRKSNSGRLLLRPFLAKLLPVAFILVSCSTRMTVKSYRIGFSQCTEDSKWIKATLDGIKKELSFHPGSTLVYRNAKDNSLLQVEQIKNLLKEDIDILLVSPNEAEPLTGIIEEVYNSGIPVVIIDRRINSDLYTAFVGADNYEIGKMAGNYVANLYKPGANVIEIIGLKGSTSSVERKLGFTEGMAVNPAIKIKRQLYGNWLKEKTVEELTKIIDSLSADDIVFAQNDPMALGAYEVYKKKGIASSAKFLGVDGLAGPGGGISLVNDGVLKATFLNPTGGEEGVQLAFKILNNEPFNKENRLSTVVVDSTNVRIMKLQTDKMNSQQSDIERQYELLEEQRRLYHNQTNLIYVFTGALVLVIIMGGISFRALRNNRRINKQLAAQNNEILTQRNQLIEMTAKAKEATDARFNFFTNISHEFRTPLTLILGPLEDALASPRLHFTIRNNLTLVQRNAMRLLRLINQLMDFRKMEEGQMKLHATENDLVAFTSEISDAFSVLANKKNITLNVIKNTAVLPVWFDTAMLDKVLFNLLSNAFKFTEGNQGIITVTIGKTRDNKTAYVRVEDSGIGMTPDEMKQAFNSFYQGENNKSKGTGLGLSLSRELVNLHRGSITVTSEKWKGTCFEVLLPVGNEHLDAEEMSANPALKNHNYEDARIYTSDIEEARPENNPATSGDKEQSILIIEDNPDLRQYLRMKLETGYEVYEAADGKEGLSLAFELIPDLIICDIVLPGYNGLHITDTIKQDIRTSHIPLVLLTAKGSLENQIEGMKLSADAFIVKPFNPEILAGVINNLLNTRAKLKEHYTSVLPSENRAGQVKKADRKFISDFTAIIEANVPNDKFSIEAICREMGISRVQLYHKVKTLLGYNVNDYLLSVRIQKAKYLLANENLTIAEITFQVGFSSQAYFSTVFKARAGCTPTEYREKSRFEKSGTSA